jgi:hypothetical protein
LTLTCTWSRFIAHLSGLQSFDHEGGDRQPSRFKQRHDAGLRRSFSDQ